MMSSKVDFYKDNTVTNCLISLIIFLNLMSKTNNIVTLIFRTSANIEQKEKNGVFFHNIHEWQERCSESNKRTFHQTPLKKSCSVAQLHTLARTDETFSCILKFLKYLLTLFNSACIISIK